MKEFIEKLIERLKEKEQILLDNTKDIGCTIGIINAMKCSKEIVNQLAEEYNNDFCEWKPNKQFNWFLKSQHEGVGITQEEKEVFKFCPCCGKKIKVVE